MATTPDNPWDSLWRELANAEWVADIGLPLALALTALFFAYRSLRTQIAHDRELARAEHRATVARALGASLNQLARIFDTTPPGTAWWAEEKWDGFSGVCRAIDEAEIPLGDNEAFDYMYDVAREISHSWQACYERRKQLLAQPDPPSFISVDNALVDTLLPARNRLKEVVMTLIRWDGYLPVPAPSSSGDWRVPLPVSQHRREYEAWRQRIQDDFQARAQDFEEKSKARPLR